MNPIEKPRAIQTPPAGKLDCDQLATAEMRHHWRDHFNHPPLINELGCFRTGPDPMAVCNFMFPPFTGNGEGTATLYLNRHHSAVDDVSVGYTWRPDRVMRRARFQGFDVESDTRALPEEPGALIRLTLTNPAASARSVEVGVKLAGRLIHTIEGWASIGPFIAVEAEQREDWTYDPSRNVMRFASAERAFLIQGTSPAPDAVEGKTFLYRITLPGGGKWSLDFVAAMAETEEEALQRCIDHLENFDQSLDRVTDLWNDRIRKAFQPDNGLYSGHLPTLVTENEDLARLYNMTTLGCLILRRDNPIAAYSPAFVTLSPNYWTTASFLWDMMIAGPFYALLDPEVMRNHIDVWLAADIRTCLATDYVTGKPLGNWYAVNSSAIVRLAHDYLRYSGDFRWLDTRVAGKSVIDHLQEHALMWHDYDRHGHGLADCGGVINLLECVSTYTHEVAAFNAMWVAALRQVAAMRRLRNELTIAKRLEDDAAALLKNVLKLYADGQGYWHCRQPDGSLHDVHHIYDFVAVLESIADDLSPAVRHEMLQNFRQNHQTENWTRSLSLWDDDAHRALRVDHQWTGSYASISAQAINGLYKLGRGEEAFEWLLRVAAVAHQGPIGQAHWVDPLYPSFKGGVWKCSHTFPFMTDWTVAANGAYPAAIIESVFGADVSLEKGVRWNGITAALDPGARLENFAVRGVNHMIDRDGIHPAP